jgi:hypothetical protein
MITNNSYNYFLHISNVTTGNPPIQFTFELQAVGQGQPPMSESQLVVPKHSLTQQTARGTYFIRLLWNPPVIAGGTPEEFGLLFMDNSQNILNQVNYGFKVTSSNDTTITEMRNQKAPDGTGIRLWSFQKLVLKQLR